MANIECPECQCLSADWQVNVSSRGWHCPCCGARNQIEPEEDDPEAGITYSKLMQLRSRARTRREVVCWSVGVTIACFAFAALGTPSRYTVKAFLLGLVGIAATIREVVLYTRSARALEEVETGQLDAEV